MALIAFIYKNTLLILNGDMVSAFTNCELVKLTQHTVS